MYPSEVREKILSDHDEIRALLQEIESIEGHEPAAEAPKELVATASLLRTRLIDHIELEDQILDPALDEVGDAWRKLRQNKLKDLHAQHERLLASLTEVLNQEPVQAKPLEDVLNALAASVREDMELEEDILLSSDVLRDDAVVIAQSDG